jgi:DNA-binding response OmpR family regulator
MRLMLIEDNLRLAGFIGSSLRREGFALDAFSTLAEGEAASDTTRFDLIILDLGLPDGDGMDLIRRLRGDGNPVPVLVLTARDALEDRVEGLNAGADDYLLKPFEVSELVARINALLRRPGAALGTLLRVGNVSFDTVGREIRVGNEILALSRRELAVLEVLMRRAGRVVPKDVIGESVYGFNETVSNNSVEVAVHRLRKRLEEVKSTAIVHTLRGVGYLLAEPDPTE